MEAPENRSLVPDPGCLYVLATPIGNLADLSHRAERLLAGCDLIACEDTRMTARLLAHLGLRRPMVAYHEHNEQEKAEELADLLAAGKSIALVSDAGTPGLSDPGFRLVRACRRRGLTVVPVPGPFAAAALLSASGLPTSGFFFAGFLPPKRSARQNFLRKYEDFEHTIVLYESCHRIQKLAEDIVEVLGPGRVVCLAKELSKRHETFLTGPAGEIAARLGTLSLKGEFGLAIAPRDYSL